MPTYWPVGVRHAGGVSLVLGFYGERGKARADTASGPSDGVGCERECVEQQKGGAKVLAHPVLIT